MSLLQHLICGPKTATKIRIGLKLVKSTNILPRISFSTTQTISNEISSTAQQSSNSKANTSDWSMVYRFPLVRWAAAFNRMKVYQSALTVVGIPAAFVFEKSELIPIGSSAVVGAIGISGIITLALCSLWVKNLIGFIYINNDMNRLKFAYVDYWGRRQDTVIEINDLVPDGEQDKPASFNFYQIIGSRNDKKLSFKLLQRYGVVDKPEVFSSLFY